jgi:hypothetical protein
MTRGFGFVGNTLLDGRNLAKFFAEEIDVDLFSGFW